ncbi:hypothetical protein [Clostridium paraputrificum]
MSFESIDNDILKKDKKHKNNSKLFDENLIVYINEVDSSQMLEVMKRGYIEMSQINLELAEECVDEISDY